MRILQYGLDLKCDKTIIGTKNLIVTKLKLLQTQIVTTQIETKPILGLNSL